MAPSTLRDRLEVDLERRTHGALDVDDLDVLPVLLEQGDQEVDGELDVEGDLSRSHGDVSHSQGHAHDLLHLELDGGLGDLDLLLEVLVLIEDGRELASLGEARTQDTRDLLNERGRGQEVVVLLGELLDELLVLVELLEVIDGHLVHAELVSLLAVLLVTQDADAGVRTRDDRELESTRETFVTRRIVVLQSDLELDGLGELAHLALELLALGISNGLATRKGKDLFNGSTKNFAVELAHCWFVGLGLLWPAAAACGGQHCSGFRGIVFQDIRGILIKLKVGGLDYDAQA